MIACKFLVGICTARHYTERRAAVRETWLSRPEDGVACVFFAGAGEGRIEEDVVQLDAPDDYRHLPAKVLAFFRWALANSDFEWLFKCDDDSYLDLSRLRHIARPGAAMVADFTFLARRAPSGGAGYLLSRSAVERLAFDASLPATGAEDVIVGRTLADDKAVVVIEGGLNGFPSEFPSAGNSVISSHPCPPERMRLMHSARDPLTRSVEAVLGGGLGNQLFQYAHGRALARRLDAEFYTSFREIGPRKFALGSLGLTLSPRPDQSPQTQITFHDSYRPSAEFEVIERAAKAEHILVRGYFQNERFFAGASAPLRAELRAALALTRNEEVPVVCVQVRRGDFLASPFHVRCSAAYYDSAMELMRKRLPGCRFVVISDDHGWCAAEFAGHPDVSVQPHQTELEALATMASASGCVISASTFGWWGAWLGGPRNVVIAPARFLTQKEWHICPPNWTLLPP